ncbi:MAG: hypothetical protein V3W41_20145 [Planctomycetota bacterium]
MSYRDLSERQIQDVRLQPAVAFGGELMNNMRNSHGGNLPYLDERGQKKAEDGPAGPALCGIRVQSVFSRRLRGFWRPEPAGPRWLLLRHPNVVPDNV